MGSPNPEQHSLVSRISRSGRSLSESLANDENNETTSLVPQEMDKPTERSLWRDSNLRQKCLLIYIIFVEFLILLCSSVPSPFLARVVENRGGTLIESAVVLQSVMLAMAFSCIFFGKYQIAIGCKRLCIAGMGLFGIFQAAFGFLQFTDDLSAFVTVGTFLRILEGVAKGAFSVATLTLLCQEFPAHITKVFGMIQAACGFGYLTGPVFGGTLFDVSGMLLPMMLSGGIVLLSVTLSFSLLKNYTVNNETDGNFRMVDVISQPRATLVLCSVATVYGGFGLYDTAMTSYVETLGLSVTHAGLVLFSSGLGYGVASIPTGYLASMNTWIWKVLMTTGFIGFVLTGLIFTPKQSIVLVFVGSFASGVLAALGTVPAFETLVGQEDHENLDGAKKLSLQSAVSGAWNFAVGIGMFSLGSMGSALTISFGSFYQAVFCTLSSGFILALFAFATTFIVKQFNRKT